MQNKLWQPLKPGDEVDVIAPAGRPYPGHLTQIIEVLTAWQLRVNMPDDILGDDLLCANSDAMRLRHLQAALMNPKSKAIICARGGYGMTRLLPALFNMQPPAQPKLVVGMSDLTSLAIFLEQQWGWASLHAAMSVWRLEPVSITAIKQALFAETNPIKFTQVEPINQLAKENRLINSSVAGGNLCLVQAGLGTAWQLNAQDKIILLEEVHERGYRVDRMLEHLHQAGIFTQAKAVIFGDFIGGEEPNGTSLIQPVLQRFAERLPIPVVHIKGIGHGNINYPIPLGTPSQLQLGINSHLLCQIN